MSFLGPVQVVVIRKWFNINIVTVELRDTRCNFVFFVILVKVGDYTWNTVYTNSLLCADILFCLKRKQMWPLGVSYMYFNAFNKITR